MYGWPYKTSAEKNLLGFSLAPLSGCFDMDLVDSCCTEDEPYSLNTQVEDRSWTLFYAGQVCSNMRQAAIP